MRIKFKLFYRKELLVPTWQGALLFVLMFALLVWLLFTNAVSFLSPQKPVTTKILIVEGWVDDLALTTAAEYIKKGGFTMVCVTGQQVMQGKYLLEYTSTAEVAYNTLLKLGVDSTVLHCIPSAPVTRNRSVASAQALATWLRSSGVKPGNILLLSQGVHSRRSWLIFKKTLHPDGWNTGVVTYQDDTYDGGRWWRSSRGTRAVISEGLAWLYVSLFGPSD